MGYAVLFFFLFLAVALRLASGRLDGPRIANYIHSQGGELLEKHWTPFGKGWWGEKNERIYQVRYRDQKGNIHDATVKTSMYTGVYFTDDRVVSHASPPSNKTALAAENERLRRKLAEMEADQEREN